MRAVAAAEVPAGSAKAVLIEGGWYAVYHDPVLGFFATDDSCPHQGASLGDGTYFAGRVICAMHNWVFDVRTGACHGVPGVSVACYATRPVGTDVEIELDAAT